MLCVLPSPAPPTTALLPLLKVISNPAISQTWNSTCHKNTCAATANTSFGGCAIVCIKPGQKISAEEKSHLVEHIPYQRFLQQTLLEFPILMN